MATTPNLGLTIGVSDETSFLDWRKGLDGNNDGTTTTKSNMQKIDEAFGEVAKQHEFYATIGITWNGEVAPFTQEITVDGILETDNPIIDIVLNNEWGIAILEDEEWSKIKKITTSENKLIVYSSEKTTTSLNINIKVVRTNG